jgi:hypothetical protein
VAGRCSINFGAVAHLTVKVYGVGEQIVSGPIHSTPLFALLTSNGHDLGILRGALASASRRSPSGPR